MILFFYTMKEVLMKYTFLGKTNIKISKITHGCMELGGGPWETLDKKHNIALLEQALDMGVTSFDTAEIYGNGNSERIVGEALKTKRNDCFIASKVARENLKYDDVIKACENSLKNLQTDYIDLLYVHWPSYEVPIEETMNAFNKLKSDGKIRAIGVSNFSLEQIKQAQKYAQIDALQPEYNMLERSIENGLLKHCNENQISVLSYNSIAKGILSGAFHLYGKALAEDDFRQQKLVFKPHNLKLEQPLLNLLSDIANTHEATVSQISIAWVIAQKGMSSAIVGTQNTKHFEENIKAVDIELSNDEIKQISQLSEEIISQFKE